MNNLTLLRAYAKACYLREMARDHRGSSFGLYVDKDRFALEYQRRYRQAESLLARLFDNYLSERKSNDTQ